MILRRVEAEQENLLCPGLNGDVDGLCAAGVAAAT